MTAQNIKVEAMKVFFGEAVAQIEKILTRADTALDSLAGKYIKLYSSANVIYVFWFRVGVTGTAPVIPGATLVQVDITALDSASAVATALAAEIDGITGVFGAVASGGEVTVTHDVEGYASSAEDGVSPLNTGFGLQIVEQGDLEMELGCVEGDIETAFEESFVEVKCHDTGTTPVATLKTGVANVEVTLAALETTREKLKQIFVKTNGSFTPSGGTEVFGMGTFKNFENMFKFAKKLRLHPARLMAGDYSEDWTFHKAIPQLEGITFSGENVLTLPITFKVFPDETKNPRVNYFSIGNGMQSLV